MSDTRGAVLIGRHENERVFVAFRPGSRELVFDNQYLIGFDSSRSVASVLYSSWKEMAIVYPMINVEQFRDYPLPVLEQALQRVSLASRNGMAGKHELLMKMQSAQLGHMLETLSTEIITG